MTKEETAVKEKEKTRNNLKGTKMIFSKNNIKRRKRNV